MEFIALLIILGSILWLMNRNSSLKITARERKTTSPAWKELWELTSDPSRMKSFDPDWVLRYLLKTHSQFFDPGDIKRVLADCVPHDKTRLQEGRVVSSDWYWIIELLPGRSQEKEKRFVYVVGLFDPRFTETRTRLKAWFFESVEEALTCAMTSLDNGIWKRRPDLKLFNFLKVQIDKGEKARRDSQGYWKERLN